jgi:hypothetical protein
MDSDNHSPQWETLAMDPSFREAWKARQLERIADSLGTIAFILENAYSGGFINVNAKPWNE